MGQIFAPGQKCWLPEHLPLRRWQKWPPSVQLQVEARRATMVLRMETRAAVACGRGKLMMIPNNGRLLQRTWRPQRHVGLHQVLGASAIAQRAAQRGALRGAAELQHLAVPHLGADLHSLRIVQIRALHIGHLQIRRGVAVKQRPRGWQHATGGMQVPPDQRLSTLGPLIQGSDLRHQSLVTCLALLAQGIVGGAHGQTAPAADV
mmetsp:Transcript_29440/g.63783  ORF Transcript_29440/g.63783 Transcript_29440/m.63783 type:complete len:205 (-) Transcript_29440:36-650(-)